MIKINLLGDETVIDTSGTWLLIGYVLSVAVAVLVWLMLYFAASSNIQEYTTQAESLEQELAKLKEITKEVRALEQKKKELADKTAVIATLKRNQLGPVRILDDLNTALPERAWLTEVRETGGLMRISGYALDNQTVAAFMKALEASVYFESIDLGESREVEKEGAKLKEFTLLTKVVYAGVAKKFAEQRAAAEAKAAASPSPSLTPESLTPSPTASVTAEATPTETPASSPSPGASYYGKEQDESAG